MNQEELAKNNFSLKELSSREIRKRLDLCLSVFDCYHRGYDFDLRSPKRLSTSLSMGSISFDFLFWPNLESFR